MQQTCVEKILSHHCAHPVQALEYCFPRVQGAMASDATAGQMIKTFKEMGGGQVWDPAALVLVLDHAAPASSQKVADLHSFIRRFAEEQSCHLYEVGAGICHHLILEHGHVSPGSLFVGADSHTCTYGAVGAFAIGVGSSDLAAVLKMGAIWLRVPESIRIDIKGALPEQTSSKDIMLKILSQLGPDAGRYKCVEYGGPYFRGLSLAKKIPFTNMIAELGAKCGFVEQLPAEDVDHAPNNFLADPKARYVKKISLDVTELAPQVVRPHSPFQGAGVDELEKIPIQMAFIGACTNTRIEDLREAAVLLKGKKIHKKVRLLISPASRQTFLEGVRDGTVEALTEAGAVFLPSGCGPCVGTHMGVPSSGENVISAANRNFRGRMGNPHAAVYLASPATVAASALKGYIANPQNVVEFA